MARKIETYINKMTNERAEYEDFPIKRSYDGVNTSEQSYN